MMGDGLLRLEEAWERLEARLCALILGLEVASLTAWVFLRGLATDYVPGGNAAGLVARALLSAALLGLGVHLATRARTERTHRLAVAGAIGVGLVAGGTWAHVGVAYGGNALNWLQNASGLMLVGGLRGLATRLTLWLALVGASLATSRGKHIHVDLLARYLPVRLRVPCALAGWLTAAAVCMAAALGFVDFITISEFRVEARQPCAGDPSGSCDTPAFEKLAALERAIDGDAFIARRQASLDLRSLPRVIAGTPYDGWLTAADWNAWLDDADWTTHFDKVGVDALRMDPSEARAKRVPAVSVPGMGDARGLLVRDLTLVFPFGLAVIAIKFLLRGVLVLLGSVEVAT